MQMKIMKSKAPAGAEMNISAPEGSGGELERTLPNFVESSNSKSKSRSSKSADNKEEEIEYKCTTLNSKRDRMEWCIKE